jgi:ABC-2 type transport system permease protein
MSNLAAFFKCRPKLLVNPIIVKELRSRMRGPRAFIILTVVLTLMGLISYALYKITLITSSWSYSPLSPQVGQTLFISLALLEMLMVLILTPAVTAGAISSEHEKLTYEMLLTTPLPPTRILWGKLVSALSYIFLLMSPVPP